MPDVSWHMAQGSWLIAGADRRLGGESAIQHPPWNQDIISVRSCVRARGVCHFSSGGKSAPSGMVSFIFPPGVVFLSPGNISSLTLMRMRMANRSEFQSKFEEKKKERERKRKKEKERKKERTKERQKRREKKRKKKERTK